MSICSEKNEVCSTPFCRDIQHSKHVDSAIWLSSWSWPMRHQSCSSAGLWPGKRTRPANKGNTRFKTSTHQHKKRQWVQMSCWMMRKIWFHSSTSLFAANVFHKCPCLGGAYNLVETYCKREVFRKYAWTPSNITVIFIQSIHTSWDTNIFWHINVEAGKLQIPRLPSWCDMFALFHLPRLVFIVQFHHLRCQLVGQIRACWVADDGMATLGKLMQSIKHLKIKAFPRKTCIMIVLNSVLG